MSSGYIRIFIFVLVLAFSPDALPGQTIPSDQKRPREHFEHADVLYDWVTNSRGEKLRTFVTRPKNESAKVPVVFFVGWLSCDSMEYAKGETDGFGTLMRRLIDHSGFATVRMDKPGVGESQGNCATADLRTELEGFQAAFESMRKYDFIDPDRVFVVGLSNGGGFSPLVAHDAKVRGFISAGSWGRTWYEHMLELERRQLEQSRKSAAKINEAMKAFTEFYNLYLTKGMTPGQVLAKHPEWKGLWQDSLEGQYGRPAVFYQQLQSLNLGETWQRVDAPVLVIRGAKDSVMSRGDGEAIVATVNSAHPGRASYHEVEGMTHDFQVNSMFNAAIVPLILEWIKRQLVPPVTSHFTHNSILKKKRI